MYVSTYMSCDSVFSEGTGPCVFQSAIVFAYVPLSAVGLYVSMCKCILVCVYLLRCVCYCTWVCESKICLTGAWRAVL